eukprot:6182651-Pleurochrysis_carterae.AAC.5
MSCSTVTCFIECISAYRRRATASCDKRCMPRSLQSSWTRYFKGQGGLDRVCGPAVRACFVVDVACWIIALCRDARAHPRGIAVERVETCT